MKKIFFTLILWELPAIAEACSVCFGNADSSVTKGLQMGIITLLCILGIVLGGFAVFFLNLRKKSRSLEGDLEHGL